MFRSPPCLPTPTAAMFTADRVRCFCLVALVCVLLSVFFVPAEAVDPVGWIKRVFGFSGRSYHRRTEQRSPPFSGRSRPAPARPPPYLPNHCEFYCERLDMVGRPELPPTYTCQLRCPSVDELVPEVFSCSERCRDYSWSERSGGLRDCQMHCLGEME